MSGALFLVFLLVVFVGMGITVLKVVQGRPPEDVVDKGYRESALTTVPTVSFMAIVVLLGVYVPPFLKDMLLQAMQFLGSQV